jgi:uncharacterized protein (DUF3820 family)
MFKAFRCVVASLREIFFVSGLSGLGMNNMNSTEEKQGQYPSNDHSKLLELAAARMPFGKHRGKRLVDLPEPYVVWFAGQGFPSGKLGDMLRTVYEIKVNGLEYLFDDL